MGIIQQIEDEMLARKFSALEDLKKQLTKPELTKLNNLFPQINSVNVNVAIDMCERTLSKRVRVLTAFPPMLNGRDNRILKPRKPT
jgi:hypothetical protein